MATGQLLDFLMTPQTRNHFVNHKAIRSQSRSMFSNIEVIFSFKDLERVRGQTYATTGRGSFRRMRAEQINIPAPNTILKHHRASIILGRYSTTTHAMRRNVPNPDIRPLLGDITPSRQSEPRNVNQTEELKLLRRTTAVASLLLWAKRRKASLFSGPGGGQRCI
jgi:hypothetical protein